MRDSPYIINITTENHANTHMEPAPTKFRLCSKGFFLTYPQCPLDRETIIAALSAKAPVIKGVVATEKHEDGSPHLHAYVKYNKTVNTVNQAYFDI